LKNLTGVSLLCYELWRGSRVEASVARAACRCCHVRNSLAPIGSPLIPERVWHSIASSIYSHARTHLHSLTRTRSLESQKSQAHHNTTNQEKKRERERGFYFNVFVCYSFTAQPAFLSHSRASQIEIRSLRAISFSLSIFSYFDFLRSEKHKFAIAVRGGLISFDSMLSHSVLLISNAELNFSSL